MGIDWSDAAIIGGILGGAITAVATVVTTYFLIAVPIRKMRPTLKANYLDTIAEALRLMAEDFSNNQVPTQSGNRLKENLKDHKEDLARDASEELKNDIFRLESLADEAVIFDNQLRGKLVIGASPARWSGQKEVTPKMWIHDALALAGKLQGRADKLRTR